MIITNQNQTMFDEVIEENRLIRKRPQSGKTTSQKAVQSLRPLRPISAQVKPLLNK